jgi:hypothetical protein
MIIFDHGVHITFLLFAIYIYIYRYPFDKFVHEIYALSSGKRINKIMDVIFVELLGLQHSVCIK